MSDLKVAPGTLLAAWPDLQDPNFVRAVILLVSHEDSGAFGLVLNRPSAITTRKLLSAHPVLGRSSFPVGIGGPVDHRTIHFLHTLPDEIPGGVPVAGALTLGGDLEALGRLILSDDEHARRHVLMLLGYSGWSPGQLESEIQVGDWLPAPLDIERIFAGSPEDLWRDTVRSIGPLARGMDLLPPDPHWN